MVQTPEKKSNTRRNVLIAVAGGVLGCCGLIAMFAVVLTWRSVTQVAEVCPTPTALGLSETETELGSRAKPYPAGTTGTMAWHWDQEQVLLRVDTVELTVHRVIRPADEIVEEADPANTSHPRDQEFMMVEVTLKCLVSCATIDMTTTTFDVYDNCGSRYPAKFDGAGIAHLVGIPDLLEDTPDLSGGPVTGYLFFAVLKAAASLVLNADHLAGGGDFFFALPDPT